MRRRTVMSSIFLAMAVGVARLAAAEVSTVDLDQRFTSTVRPFLAKYCLECHGTSKPKGDLDLASYTNVAAVVADAQRWQSVLDRLESGEMPPKKAMRHPQAALRREVIDWLTTTRRREADRNAGDPGVVLPHRLSNAEYNYTVRDLTGVDIQPTKEFPVDPANEAGFDNSGESLSMSPALVKKYLQAARRVAEHLVLQPSGLAFAPHPVMVDTDRDKYCVNRIVQFYARQPTDLAAYFRAAWRYKNRSALGKPNATLAAIAAEAKVSPGYLATVWSLLTDAPEPTGPVAELQAMWRRVPVPTDARSGDGGACERMRDFVVELRGRVKPQFTNLSVKGMAPGSQPLVLWKDRQFATSRTVCPSNSGPGFRRFCAVFPDAFFVSERGRMYLDQEKEKADGNVGRLLSAGLHNQMGYFRDDAPLYQLVLDPQQRRTLDGLWLELDMVAGAAARQHLNFLWFERTDSRFMTGVEFDPYRSEDPDSTSASKIKGLSAIYLAKVKLATNDPIAIEAVSKHFDIINAAIRRAEHARLAAEPSHLDALIDFAGRAYRRPLSQAERDDLLGFYRGLRAKNALGHEDAVRDTLVSILMSPHFSYRIDPPLAAIGPVAAHGWQPLSDHALAGRLSYFLWSSMPDAQLLARAADGTLHEPEVLLTETRRMVRDPRLRALAVEFGGNWLDVRRFEEHNSVDRERFKSFDNDLRQAMYEEPLRFLVDLAQRDGSVLDLLYGDYTFVNQALARHYGMPAPQTSPDTWTRIEHASQFERGGLLPMAVFLTKNAPGLRTSPVKRGYWVVRRLLGERIPPPPATVPELPADEVKLGDLTLREALVRHRRDSACSGCHARFDSVGLVFESYGPIGERRSKDFGGRPVDSGATFPGGSQGNGLTGLRRYIREHRQDDFVDNLSRKLFAYALCRSLLLSDDAAIATMRAKLANNEYRVSALIESIVTSPQFLTRRGQTLAQDGKP